jgi:hypothetical protein
MRRDVTIAQPLPAGTGYERALQADPGCWLPEARASGLNVWLVSVGPSPRLRRPVRCRVGRPVQFRRSTVRHVTWEPVEADQDVIAMERVVPGLDGQLRLVRSGPVTSLLFVGDVLLPLGRVGQAVDTLVLHRAADRTVSAFVAAVAARLCDAAAVAPSSPGPVVPGPVVPGPVVPGPVGRERVTRGPEPGPTSAVSFRPPGARGT